MLKYKLRWSLIGKWPEDIRRTLSLAHEWWTSENLYEDWLFEGIRECLGSIGIKSKIYITDEEFPEDIKIPELIRKALSGNTKDGKRREPYYPSSDAKLLKVMNSEGLLLICEYETDMRDEEQFSGYEKICFIRSNGKRYILE